MTQPPDHTPLTDEQIRESTIGELDQHAAPIVLAAYDTEWPRLFERAAERLRGVLGERAL